MGFYEDMAARLGDPYGVEISPGLAQDYQSRLIGQMGTALMGSNPFTMADRLGSATTDAQAWMDAQRKQMMLQQAAAAAARMEREKWEAEQRLELDKARMVKEAAMAGHEATRYGHDRDYDADMAETKRKEQEDAGELEISRETARIAAIAESRLGRRLTLDEQAEARMLAQGSVANKLAEEELRLKREGIGYYSKQRPGQETDPADAMIDAYGKTPDTMPHEERLKAAQAVVDAARGTTPPPVFLPLGGQLSGNAQRPAASGPMSSIVGAPPGGDSIPTAALKGTEAKQISDAGAKKLAEKVREARRSGKSLDEIVALLEEELGQAGVDALDRAITNGYIRIEELG